jgi:ABC-type Na+ transport system ATPase subunit NatA
VEAGELFGLLGPNGAGKTALTLIALLDKNKPVILRLVVVNPCRETCHVPRQQIDFQWI